MSEQKNTSRLLDMPLKDALTRFLRTNPKELEVIQKSVKKRKEEIEQNVDKTREDIERGVRPAGKQFRL